MVDSNTLAQMTQNCDWQALHCQYQFFSRTNKQGWAQLRSEHMTPLGQQNATSAAGH